jgi:hypothetical protein
MSTGNVSPILIAISPTFRIEHELQREARYYYVYRERNAQATTAVK